MTNPLTIDLASNQDDVFDQRPFVRIDSDAAVGFDLGGNDIGTYFDSASTAVRSLQSFDSNEGTQFEVTRDGTFTLSVDYTFGGTGANGVTNYWLLRVDPNGGPATLVSEGAFNVTEARQANAGNTSLPSAQYGDIDLSASTALTPGTYMAYYYSAVSRTQYSLEFAAGGTGGGGDTGGGGNTGGGNTGGGATTAKTYGGIDFPLGDASFADRVISYEPDFDGGPPRLSSQVPNNGLGAPNNTAFSLGDGGRVTFFFEDVVLVGSGDDGVDDLHIFEIGPDVEDTFIEISRDGTNWLSVGAVRGATDSVDIDPFLEAAGLPYYTTFRYVRITDDTDKDGQGSGGTVGADIEAVGVTGRTSSVLGTNSDDSLSVTLAQGQFLIGLGGNDTLTGGTGTDIFDGGGGNDIMNGGGGLDVAVYDATRAEITIDNTGSGFTVTRGTEVDTLTDVERIDLNDGSYVRLDVGADGAAGEAYRVYQAAFARTPDKAGLEFWIGQRDNGLDLTEIARGFTNSSEFAQVYGTNLSTEAYVDKLYENILGRDAEAVGRNFWIEALNNGGVSRVDVLEQFSEGDENFAGVARTIEDGILIA